MSATTTTASKWVFECSCRELVSEEFDSYQAANQAFIAQVKIGFPEHEWCDGPLGGGVVKVLDWWEVEEYDPLG